MFDEPLLSMDYSSYSPLEATYDYTPSYNFSDYSDYGSSLDDFGSYGLNSIVNDYSGYVDPIDFSSYGDNDQYQIPYQVYADAMGQGSQQDQGILSNLLNIGRSGFDKANEFINGKGNMSALLTLATLASLGQKPKGPVNATGSMPSSVRATEIYDKFTPSQQANMEAFAAKKDLRPLAQQFDPRLYGYGGEIKFFDREA